ncbi:plasmid mobilization protein [Cohaesibacter haloalkalitolerans]|uniref:plasmid mobilization protein n=1 Tax=Cohaesibacter haloalkalitolerans TaxID=1162980 RepID=UPI000E65248A|nr:hypothetical protein [Cohaesibacter haloalkalitolerans]
MRNLPDKEPRKFIKVFVTKQEREYIATLAENANVSQSRLLLTVFLRGKMPDISTKELIRELMKLRADLARLGNLQLKGMNEIQNGKLVAEMQLLLREARENQTLIAEKIKKISI